VQKRGVDSVLLLNDGVDVPAQQAAHDLLAKSDDFGYYARRPVRPGDGAMGLNTPVHFAQRQEQGLTIGPVLWYEPTLKNFSYPVRLALCWAGDTW
jgi:hypothetical protein